MENATLTQMIASVTKMTKAQLVEQFINPHSPLNLSMIQLIKERDEARRMYCSKVEGNSRQYGTSSKDVAK